MKKWSELSESERKQVLEFNCAAIDNQEAYIQLVSTGPYYFDDKGQAYTHVA